MAANLARIYGFDVPVINGDAPTGTLSRSPEAMNRTRFAALCRRYDLTSVTPLDMFPQTAEIKVPAHLTLRA